MGFEPDTFLSIKKTLPPGQRVLVTNEYVLFSTSGWPTTIECNFCAQPVMGLYNPVLKVSSAWVDGGRNYF